MLKLLLLSLLVTACGDNTPGPATDARCPAPVDAACPAQVDAAPATCGTCTRDTMPGLVTAWLAAGAPQPANNDVTTLLEVWAANNCQ